MCLPPRSIEYGSTGWTEGQVIGGRWKPLHHILGQHLYRDQIAACGGDGRCFVRNDDPINGFTGTLLLSMMQLPSGAFKAVSATPVKLGPGAAAFQWLCLGGGTAPDKCDSMASVLPTLGCAADGSDCILVHNLTAEGTEAIADENFGLLAPPGSLKLPTGVSVGVTVTGVINPDGTAEVVVTSTGPALFVTLTSLAQGRFSENVLHMPSAGSRTIAFVPFGGPVQMDVLATSTRVEHLGLYQGQ